VINIKFKCSGSSRFGKEQRSHIDNQDCQTSIPDSILNRCELVKLCARLGYALPSQRTLRVYQAEFCRGVQFDILDRLDVRMESNGKDM
jgi:hypothetical protein